MFEKLIPLINLSLALGLSQPIYSQQINYDFSMLSMTEDQPKNNEVTPEPSSPLTQEQILAAKWAASLELQNSWLEGKQGYDAFLDAYPVLNEDSYKLYEQVFADFYDNYWAEIPSNLFDVTFENSWAEYAGGGHETGNGGDGVVCTQNGSTNYMTYDMWEIKNRLNFGEFHPINLENKKLKDMVHLAILNLATQIDFNRDLDDLMKFSAHLIDQIPASFVFWDSIGRKDGVDDQGNSTSFLTASNCYETGLAVYFDQVQALAINHDFFNRLELLDKAVLIVHETLYKYFRAKFFDNNKNYSGSIRILTNCAFAEGQICQYLQPFSPLKESSKRKAYCHTNDMDFFVELGTNPFNLHEPIWIFRFIKFSSAHVPVRQLISFPYESISFKQNPILNYQSIINFSDRNAHYFTHSGLISLIDEPILSFALQVQMVSNPSGELLLGMIGKEVEKPACWSLN